jgi:poly-beta-1,6-N-acetyl-D-glucosamine biosynthesis protein PgaD
MEKSGPRSPDLKIINKPELRTPLRKILEGCVTILLWSIWIYFIIPAITVILWVFGIRYFWSAFLKGGGFSQLLFLIRNAGIVILITFILDMVWVCYNFAFYKSFSKKKRYEPLSLDSDLAKVFSISPESVMQGKKSHRISLVLKDNKVTVTSS